MHMLPAGQIDAYYQYKLKPYDVAAGIVILEEAGGRVTTADGSAYSVFDRSLLATNDALYEQVCAFWLDSQCASSAATFKASYSIGCWQQGLCCVRRRR
jgi:3'-phosphoadenosine 5'-phosphosulfate (PAPS) 3'-phosphatase